MATIQKGQILRSDLNPWDGLTKTANRIDSTGGTISGVKIGDSVDVLTVYGDYINYTWATISNALAALSSNSVTLIFATGTWAITDDLTIPSNFTCLVPAGCIFNISAGKTLTFNGPVLKEAKTFTSGPGTLTRSTTASNVSVIDDFNITTQKTNATNAIETNLYNYTLKRKMYASVDYGVIGGTGLSSAQLTANSTALQNAIDDCVSNQWTLVLDGVFEYDTPLATSYNLTLQGMGAGFTSGLRPIDCSALRFDTIAEATDIFNIHLRDFTIWCAGFTGSGSEVDTIIYWAGFYRCTMTNIRLNSVPLGSGVGKVLAGIEVGNGFCYENRFERTYISVSGSTGNGIGFLIDHTSGCLVLEQPDAENMNIGIYLGNSGGGQTEIIRPHIERDNNGIWIKANHSRALIRGGNIDLPSASSNGIVFDGAFDNDEIINIDVGFTSSDHATKKTAISVANVTSWTTQKMGLTNIDWSWISFPTNLDKYANFYPYNPKHSLQKRNYSFYKSGVADVTNTQIFKITASTNTPIYVKVKTFLEHAGYSIAIDESAWVMVKNSATGTYYEKGASILNQIETNAANYSITTLTVTATPNTTTDVTWDVYVDFNTAIITTIDFYSSVEILGDCTVTAL